MCAMQSNNLKFKHCNASEIEILIVVHLHITIGILCIPRVNLNWDPKIIIAIFHQSEMSKQRFFKSSNNLHLSTTWKTVHHSLKG